MCPQRSSFNVLFNLFYLLKTQYYWTKAFIEDVPLVHPSFFISIELIGTNFLLDVTL